MKICWDNLEGLSLTKVGKFKDNQKNYFIYHDSCECCNEPFLGGTKSKFCTISCGKQGNRNPAKRKEVRDKLSKLNTNKNHPQWLGGLTEKNIPSFKTYSQRIDWCEKVRNNNNALEIKCLYCGKWFSPKISEVCRRIDSLNEIRRGEQRFYCSEGCKNSCTIYGKSAKTLMKEDAVKACRDPWWELPREVQPELRQIVFKRDEWKCIKCGSNENLHCHHIEGLNWEPLLSADVDMCITVCKQCHGEIHKKEGCTYNDMKCK